MENYEKNTEMYDKPTKIDKGPMFGKRHIQAILLLFCVTIEVMTRSSLSLSIVAMTDNTTSINPNVPTYNWSDKSVILSSFYWGHVVLQVVAGQLGKNYGVKWLLFGAMGFNSLALALVPLAAQLGGSKGVMALRIFQGLAQGGLFPSCHTMMGRWAPEHERGRLATFIYSGMHIGPIIGLPITGLISRSYVGWPVTCYLFAGCGFLWCVIWYLFGSSSPAEHSSISPEEKKYIEESLNQSKNQKVVPTPWKEIFTSIHCWACLISTTGTGFGVILIQNELPTYLEKALDFDITSSGFLTSMTSVISLVFSYIFGPLTDFIIIRKYVSQTNARRIIALFTTWGNAAAMLALAFIDKSQAHMAIFILSVAAAFNAGIFFGHGVNPIDLSPRFSGIILACVNSTSMLVALTAPLVVQFLVSDETKTSEWRSVFLISAAMYTLPSAFFAIFVSGERQWWDEGGKNVRNKKVSSDTLDESTISTTNEKV